MVQYNGKDDILLLLTMLALLPLAINTGYYLIFNSLIFPAFLLVISALLSLVLVFYHLYQLNFLPSWKFPYTIKIEKRAKE